MTSAPTWVDRVHDALAANGKRSVRELTNELQGQFKFKSARQMVNPAIKTLRDLKLIHVAAWERRQEPGMQRPYPVALFAVGPWKDAKKPPPMTAVERNKIYRQKQKRFVPSVFHLGVTFKRGGGRRIGNGFNIPSKS